MTDPWETFRRDARGGDAVGYFERRPPSGVGAGHAHYFTRGEVESIRRSADPTELARATASFLRGGSRRGVVAYLGFDAVGLFEPALRRVALASPFPLGEIAYVAEMQSGSVPPGRRSASTRGAPRRALEDSMTRRQFESSVRRIRRDVIAGEAFQVVLAHRRTWRRPVDLVERAGRLRASERYRYFFYLRFGDRELVGASPESVVEVDRGRAYISPIAGTVPLDERRRSRLPLERDPKELAEHRMLVDLARNDLGGIARTGSVRLLWRERGVEYARVRHLVSRVGARLRPSVGPWEALAAAFPAGTVSGAPKIRATEILRREEATWRGPYAGTVGLVRPGGRADWALTIRAGFAVGPYLYTAAGAGIVHRSEPHREYEETLVKMAQVESELVGGTA